ncbi:MAG TPA: hypothetical protein PKM32_07015, partial [Planctomycetota bacterium]|nr:hypothetical protein [Planctomycetota bacterium]
MEQKKQPMQGKEIYSFRCPQGHQNYLNVQDNIGFEHTTEDKVIVTCQHCGWKSSPFTPKVFQQADGEYLLWIYTTKETTAINSICNI